MFVQVSPWNCSCQIASERLLVWGSRARVPTSVRLYGTARAVRYFTTLPISRSTAIVIEKNPRPSDRSGGFFVGFSRVRGSVSGAAGHGFLPVVGCHDGAFPRVTIAGCDVEKAGRRAMDVSPVRKSVKAT